MAKNTKKKANRNARFKAKKVATYDNRLIIIVAVALAVLAVGIVTAVAINSYLTSFVCKVGGERLMNYEYEMFLGTTKEEMESEAEDAGEDTTDYWTDEKIAEAEEQALADAVEWKSQYLVAKANGYALTKSEKSDYESTVESNLYYMWYVNYSSYYSDFSSFLTAYLGNIEYDDYIKFAYQDKAIANYREALQEGYDQTADSFKSDVETKYTENEDTYRRVALLTLAVDKGDAPTAVDEPTAPTMPTTDYDETAEEWINYNADLELYNTNKAAYDEYLEELATYKEENATLLTKLDSLLAQMNETGIYTGEGFVESTSTDDDGNSVTSYASYTDAALGEIAEAECEVFSSTSGVYEFTSESTSDSLIIDDYALSLHFTDDTRTAIETSLTDAQFATESFANEDGTIVTKYILIEDDEFYYVTMCTGILDLVTSGEGTSTDDETSVWDTVAEDVLEDMSLAELNEKVAEKAYTTTATKAGVVATVAEKVFES